MHKKLTLFARVILGLIFVVFGLNGFFQFIPAPPMTPEASNFAGALFATGYFFPFLKTLEILCGLSILTGQFLTLGLVVIAPVIVNIFLFHLFLDKSGLPMASFMMLLGLYLGYAYKGAYKAILCRHCDKNHCGTDMAA